MFGILDASLQWLRSIVHHHIHAGGGGIVRIVSSFHLRNESWRQATPLAETRAEQYTYIHHCCKRAGKKGTGMNGINLSLKSLPGQALTEFTAWFCHEVVLFRTSFDDARFGSVGAMRVDHKSRQGRTGFGGAMPAQGVDEADAVDGHFLPTRRFEHHHSD